MESWIDGVRWTEAKGMMVRLKDAIIRMTIA